MSQRATRSDRSPERPHRLIQSKAHPTTSPARSADAVAPGGPDLLVQDGRLGLLTSGPTAFPQLRRQARSPPVEQPASRALGVHSILNPSIPASDEDRNPGPQHGGIYPSSSPRTAAHTGPEGPSALSPRSRKRTESSTQADDLLTSQQSHGPRRVLTPVSPRSRAASHGPRRNPATYPVGSGLSSSAQPSDGRHYYTADPGQSHDSDIPPLPVSGLAAREVGAYRPGLDSMSGSSRPSFSSYNQTLGLAGPAGRPSESPNTSQSSYSNISQTSPQYRYGAPPVPQSPYASQPPPPSNYQPGSHASGISEAHYGIGQGQHYRMTLDTEHGPMTVPVELDLQQASKSADEKRKRNAGASARFRQRRKEKEKEASVTIASLEKDIKALEEEREFYFNERNFWRDFSARTVGTGQLPPRPRSPLPRRQSIQMSSEGGSVVSQDPGPAEVQTMRTQRRRTGDYQPSPGGGQPLTPMLPPQHPGQQQVYVSHSGGPLPPMQSLYGEARTGTPSQLPHPPTLPPVSRSQSYDNLRPSNPYDRSWNPGR